MSDNEITSTSDLADDLRDSSEEPSDPRTGMAATKEPEGRGLEFHISMRDYTMRDMEDLIVQAAAKQIIGFRNDQQVVKAIEQKCIELVDHKASKALESVTAAIIDQPLTPAFGEKKPVTMREFLGLYGREYLTEPVGNDGKPGRGGWDKDRSRIEWLVSKHLDRHFKAEIEKATNAVITEIRREIEAQHKAFLAEEKTRFRLALEKTVSGEK